MNTTTTTPFWLEIRKEYIDDSFDKLLTYLQKTSGTKDDPYYETTILLLRQRIEQLITQLSTSPLYKEDVDKAVTTFNCKLLAVYLLVDGDFSLSRTAYVAFMYQLSLLNPRFADIIVKTIMKRLRHEKVVQLGYTWTDLNAIGTDLFVHNLCTFTTFAVPLRKPVYYENSGCARLDQNGLILTYKSLEATRKGMSTDAKSIETAIGICLHTESYEKLKVSAKTNIVEMDEFVKNFIYEQNKTKKPKTLVKRAKPYYDGEETLVRITSIDSLGKINVETVDPNHARLTGSLTFHKLSLVYYYTSTFHEIFRPGDCLRATVEDCYTGVFCIENQIVDYFVDSIKEALHENGTNYVFLGKLIAETNNFYVWLNDWGIAMYSLKDGDYRRGDFAELTVQKIETGEYHGKIDAYIVGPSDDSFDEKSMRNDCIRYFAQMEEVPPTTVEKEPAEELSPALLRLLLRQLFFYQKTLMKPSERYAHLAHAHIMAELVNDKLSASYINFASTYLRVLVQFVSKQDISGIQLHPDAEYSQETPTLLRLSILQILKEYGKKETSESLKQAIDYFKDKQPMLSNLAKLIQTSNAIQGILSKAALNVIHREIIKTLSLETENDADLEAENGFYLGVESGTQEFKTSMVYPPNNQMQADEYTQNKNVLRGICAFLNSTTGGVLYLGVNDQGYVTGIEDDMSYLKITSVDHYMRYVQDTAIKNFGIDVTPYLRLEPLFDDTVVAVHVDPHPYHVVELNDIAYMRVNAESREIPEQVRLELIDRKVFKDRNRAAAISQLQHAVSQKRCAILHNYASSNTGKVGDRKVEAYDIRPEDNLAICYDCDKSEPRVFNINRIGYVEILEDQPWCHQLSHKTVNVDDFHMTGQTPIHLSLQLDLMAKNLLVEEFPRAKEHLKVHKGNENIWYYDAPVYDIKGIGRFYIGLANHIQLLEAPQLKQYVEEFKRQYL